jgi:hypothetical protein
VRAGAVCYQVEVSTLGLSLVQSSYTEWGVSECDRESSTMTRSWPTRSCCAVKKKTQNCIHLRDYKYNSNEFNIQPMTVKQHDLHANTLKNETDLSDLRIYVYTLGHRQGAASQVRNQCFNGTGNYKCCH